MFELLNETARPPERVVILGAGGFIGGAARARLEADGIRVLSLAREDLDLLKETAAKTLAVILRPQDFLVVVSARAPCKTNDDMVTNVTMMNNVCRALEESPVAHVTYISSDAVYSDSSDPLAESSTTAPDNLHGMMHLARECMLKAVLNQTPLATLRPSLLYGLSDPHNGYGPNRFRRLAAEGHDIVLFGEGEERRDHVLIDDLAEMIRLAVLHKAVGTLNVVTGRVASFREIAEMVASHFDAPVEIKGTRRTGSMPHNGYRAFDNSMSARVFPGFRYTGLADGIGRVHEQMIGAGK